jgi:Kef-type K+ transport system membrane component KefB
MLTSYHITVLFLSLGVLLFAARVLGELAQRFHQPAVLGELMAGMVIPFFIALTAALVIPGALGRHSGVDPTVFALFFAIAISISALPVIARILMDMGLYRTDPGKGALRRGPAACIFLNLGWETTVDYAQNQFCF